MFDSEGEDGDVPDVKKGRSALSFAAGGDEDENEAGGGGGGGTNNRRFDASSKYVDSGYMTLKSKSGRGLLPCVTLKF